MPPTPQRPRSSVSANASTICDSPDLPGLYGHRVSLTVSFWAFLAGWLQAARAAWKGSNEADDKAATDGADGMRCMPLRPDWGCRAAGNLGGGQGGGGAGAWGGAGGGERQRSAMRKP